MEGEAAAVVGAVPLDPVAECWTAADRRWWGRTAWGLLEGVRARAPLVHCITNLVSMDLMANALLAAGASPAMVHSIQEIPDFAPRADALLVNVGTLSDAWLPSMLSAAEAAVAVGRPWVLDPVAVSASDFRMRACLGLLELRPAVVRGNASEILALSSACRMTSSKMADNAPVPLPTIPGAKQVLFCPCCNDLRGSLPTQWILCDECFIAFKEGDQTVQTQSQDVPPTPPSAVSTTEPSEDPPVLEDDPYDVSQVVCSLE